MRHRSKNLKAHLGSSKLAFPAWDAVFEWLLVGWKRHTLCHDNVVIKKLAGLFWGFDNVCACVLVGQDLKFHIVPLMLHFVQCLRTHHMQVMNMWKVWSQDCLDLNVPESGIQAIPFMLLKHSNTALKNTQTWCITYTQMSCNMTL